jgi:AraC family transcriptional regulator
VKPIATERARSKRAVLRHVCCGLGPRDRPFPERHEGWTVALVQRGAFAYRAHDVRRPRDLREGWLLLGRDGADYECGHPTSGGDECLALEVSAALVEDVRSAVRLGGRDPFPTSVLPPVARVVAELAAADRVLSAPGGERAADVDAIALAVVEAVLGACGAGSPRAREPSARDHERVAAALDAIDERPEQPWALGDLAELVDASPFHFARAFRAVVGTTPHRYLVAARLRRAARLLLDTSRRVTDVAYEVGFGDLSNFVHTFRREMGSTPAAYRTRGRGGGGRRDILRG